MCVCDTVTEIRGGGAICMMMMSLWRGKGKLMRIGMDRNARGSPPFESFP